MRVRFPQVAIFALLIMTVAAAAAATAAVPKYFWPAAKDVAIFTDGSAFVIREGDADYSAGGILTAKVPRAVLGTLDVYALTEGAYIDEIVSLLDASDASGTITDLGDFYRQLAGLNIAVECGQVKIEGVLKAVLNPGYLQIESGGDSTNLVPMTSVTKLSVSGNPTPRIAYQPRLRIKVGNVKDGTAQVKLGLSYLNQDWSWSPSYRLNLKPENKAELIHYATVVNGDEDVKDAVLHLIDGTPNFLMRGTLSPLVFDVQSGGFVPAPAPMVTRLSESKAALADSYTDNQVQAEGQTSELFFYQKKGFSLQAGQRMQLMLFHATIPCKPFYKWVIGFQDLNGSYSQSNIQQQGKISDTRTGQIWQYLRLTNNTVIPWGAAPAMVVSDWKPVAQDMMRPVPVNSTFDLRVLASSDIKGIIKEEEAGRRIYRPANSRTDYLLITVRGTITVENHKANAVGLEVSKDLWGDVKDAGKAKASKSPESLWNINPHSHLMWSFDVPANDKKELTYTYEYYVGM